MFRSPVLVFVIESSLALCVCLEFSFVLPEPKEAVATACFWFAKVVENLFFSFVSALSVLNCCSAALVPQNIRLVVAGCWAHHHCPAAVR